MSIDGLGELDVPQLLVQTRLHRRCGEGAAFWTERKEVSFRTQFQVKTNTPRDGSLFSKRPSIAVHQFIGFALYRSQDFFFLGRNAPRWASIGRATPTWGTVAAAFIDSPDQPGWTASEESVLQITPTPLGTTGIAGPTVHTRTQIGIRW